MTYLEQIDAIRATDAVLGEFVASARNTEWILKNAPAAGIPLASIDLVQQDEYSYDLFLHLPDSRWLVFGVT